VIVDGQFGTLDSEVGGDCGGSTVDGRLRAMGVRDLTPISSVLNEEQMEVLSAACYLPSAPCCLLPAACCLQSFLILVIPVSFGRMYEQLKHTVDNPDAMSMLYRITTD
jgi:hypothetical protein